jgi:hypothetical protein
MKYIKNKMMIIDDDDDDDDDNYMMMEILQCHLFIIHHLKIYEYTCKHKFYMIYEMYNVNMINEISPLTSS